MTYNEKTGKFKQIANVITNKIDLYEKILSYGPKIPFFGHTIYIEGTLDKKMGLYSTHLRPKAEYDSKKHPKNYHNSLNSFHHSMKGHDSYMNSPISTQAT